MSRPSTKKGNQVSSLFFPTSQANVRSFLSTGLLGPRAVFRKHYPDLLDLAPGRLPLFAHHPSLDVWRAACPEAMDTLFPVCVEIPAALLGPGRASALLKGGLGVGDVTESDVVPPSPETIALAGPIFVPLDPRILLHFPSEAHLAEWNAREFNDLRTDDLEARVTPDIFQGASPGMDAIQGWLSTLQEPAATGPSWSWVDRTAGAACLLLMGAVNIRKGPASAFLPILGGIPSPETPASVLLPWLESCGSQMDPSLAGTVGSVVRALADHDWHSDRRGADLFGRILDRVLSDLPEEQRHRAAQIREKGQAILRNEAEVKPRHEGNDGLSDLFRALLRTLQDPTPDTLLSRIQRMEEPETVWGGMLVFAGLLSGLSGLPANLKPRTLFQWLAHQEAHAMAGPGGIGPAPLPPLEAIRRVSDKSVLHALVAGDGEVLGWDETIPTPLSLLDGRDLKTSPFREAAVGLCRAMRWEDLIWSEIMINGFDRLELSPGLKRQVAIRVKLPNVPVTYCVEPAAFLDRLAEEEDRIPPGAVTEMMAELGMGDSLPVDGVVPGAVKKKAPRRPKT